MTLINDASGLLPGPTPSPHSRAVQCLYYDVLEAGVQTTVGIDMSKLALNLAGKTDATGEEFHVFLETSDEVILSASSSFSFYLSMKARSANIDALLVSLTGLWKAARAGW